jgi:amidase
MSDMVDPTAPLTTLIAALEHGEVSARELLDLHLERIDHLDGPINSVITLEPDRARAQATAIDDARANHGDVGPLAGVPITIKDAIATAGIRSTGGAIELRDFVPDVDATVVDTVRRAGAVVFGKTNIPRWSGDYQSYNEIFGTTNNPWDLTRTPGGSSGGPAAAVAMGFSAFEIGTDIGGSIRVPSSFCGVFGHKPSFGVIPTYGYLDHPTLHRNIADVNVFGPIARSVDDLELLLGLLAGPNPDDAAAWKLEFPPPRATELGDFRVAAWLDDPFSPVEPAVLEVLNAAVDRLEAAGARIDRRRRPDLDPQRAAFIGGGLISVATAISETDEEFAATDPSRVLPHRSWDVLHRERGEFRQRWAEFFTGTDVLLCPVVPVPPFRHVHTSDGSNWSRATLADHGERPYRDLIGWSALIGSVYLPVTVAPIGRTVDGLPIGVQVVAPYLEDRTALAFARCISDVLGGYVPPPAAASGTLQP